MKPEGTARTRGLPPGYVRHGRPDGGDPGTHLGPAAAPALPPLPPCPAPVPRAGSLRRSPGPPTAATCPRCPAPRPPPSPARRRGRERSRRLPALRRPGERSLCRLLPRSTTTTNTAERSVRGGHSPGAAVLGRPRCPSPFP